MGRLLAQPESADIPEREADAEAFPLWVKQTRKWSLVELTTKATTIKKKKLSKTQKPNLNKILNKTNIKM